jgi:tRNA pseudouridine55 synthase
MSSGNPGLISGAILIDKPEGMTSSDVVTKLKWAFVNHGYAPKGFKIGHGGTLDPFATGVLAVFFGEATKLADAYLHSVKAYSGKISLGSRTDTGDLTGEVVETLPVPAQSLADWQQLANVFTRGDYFQTPPMYSAKKVGGKALHQLARQGIEIEREAILKRIESFVLCDLGADRLNFETTCESGTYVRVLAEDLAKLAGTAAHLVTLRRIRSSDLQIDNCASLTETLTSIESKAPLESLKGHVRLESLGSHLPKLPVPNHAAVAIRNGTQAEIQRTLNAANGLNSISRYVLAESDGTLVALLERSNESTPFRLQRVFNS